MALRSRLQLQATRAKLIHVLARPSITLAAHIHAIQLGCLASSMASSERKLVIWLGPKKMGQSLSKNKCQVL